MRVTAVAPSAPASAEAEKIVETLDELFTQLRVIRSQVARMRRLVMIELHLAALIPVFAVMMARGLGYR